MFSPRLMTDFLCRNTEQYFSTIVGPWWAEEKRTNARQMWQRSPRRLVSLYCGQGNQKAGSCLLNSAEKLSNKKSGLFAVFVFTLMYICILDQKLHENWFDVHKQIYHKDESQKTATRAVRVDKYHLLFSPILTSLKNTIYHNILIKYQLMSST